MNDLKETIARVRELDAKATQCPSCKGKGWILDTTYDRTGERNMCGRCSGRGNIRELLHIQQLLTAAPKLATACEDLLAENAKLRGLIEAAPHGDFM